MTDREKKLKLQEEGRAYHCATRQIWGDGECECDLYEKGYDPYAWMKVNQSILSLGDSHAYTRPPVQTGDPTRVLETECEMCIHRACLAQDLKAGDFSACR